jgi:hypothetical protein
LSTAVASHNRAMFVATEGRAGLGHLVRKQSGVVTLEQLQAVGLSRSFIASQVDAARWARWARDVVLLHNTHPTRDQLMWIALLDAGQPAALASHTSLEQCGFRGFAAEAKLIHIVVPRGAKCANLPGVVVHESRRFGASDVRIYGGLPCTEVARSTIDAAAWQRWPRFAVAMLAAVVQQRVSDVDELSAALRTVGRVNHKRYMRQALADIAGGAESLGEIDVAKLCRRFRVRPPDRQKLRRDPSGRRRYLDCEWDLGDGEIVVLEIDGSHHHLVEYWEADMKRERQVVISRRWVLRATASEVRLDGAAVMRDLIAMGVPRLP